MDPNSNYPDPSKPVAYDANGNPLYAAPQMPKPSRPQTPPAPDPHLKSHITTKPDSLPGYDFDPKIRAQYANEPDVVHAARPIEPPKREISDELKRKHYESIKRYPNLNLSEAEYVIMSIKRHPIGLIIPMTVTILLVMILLGAIMAYPLIEESLGGNIISAPVFAIINMLIIMLVGLGGYISVWVYVRNTFYLTNESVIQEIQHSLFSRHEQTVSLGSIEDASFVRTGILQTLLNYGSIRLSTEGEETTYRFHYVADPKKQVAVLNNAVESFKNGRPVSGSDPYEDD